MDKQKVRHHSAAVLILPKGSVDQALTSSYQPTYGIPVFANNFYFIGGNATNDHSPLSLLERELKEELQPHVEEVEETIGDIIGSSQGLKNNQDYLKGRKFIDSLTMSHLRDHVLHNLNHFADYLVTIDASKVGIKDRNELIYLSTIFTSEIDPSLFAEVACQVREGKELTNEGYTKILSASALKSGEILGSWAYAPATSRILGINLPEHDFVRVKDLSRKISSFKDYKIEFEYERDPETKR